MAVGVKVTWWGPATRLMIRPQLFPTHHDRRRARKEKVTPAKTDPLALGSSPDSGSSRMRSPTGRSGQCKQTIADCRPWRQCVVFGQWPTPKRARQNSTLAGWHRLQSCSSGSSPPHSWFASRPGTVTRHTRIPCRPNSSQTNPAINSLLPAIGRNPSGSSTGPRNAPPRRSRKCPIVDCRPGDPVDQRAHR